MEAIRVDNLTRRFNGFTAVDGLTFTVATGELFGLLGPNGAGKTTTINMLATLLKPSGGAARVAGHDVAQARDDVRKSIGIVFQEPALDTRLTGRENLAFHAMMYGIGREARKERLAEVLRLVELEDRADVLVEKYSGGMKRRLEIARGLIQRPRVLFLDEPTLGLDAQTRRRIWDYIKALNRETGVTIILTTHYMEEADYLCERVAIMDAGRFVALDTPGKLKDVLGGDVVTLEIEGDAGPFVDRLKAFDWVRNLALRDGVLNLTTELGERRIPELVSEAQRSGLRVSCVNLRKPSLEDVFLHFTGRTIREEEATQGDRRRYVMRTHGGRR
jgi:ABC-2 type transport system ATP-binding protein